MRSKEFQRNQWAFHRHWPNVINSARNLAHNFDSNSGQNVVWPTWQVICIKDEASVCGKQEASSPVQKPCNGELWMQKLKSCLLRTWSWKVLPLKPGVGQYIAIHATLTARDFFLANFYPSSAFTCIFSKTSPEFFLFQMWLIRFLCRPAE